MLAFLRLHLARSPKPGRSPARAATPVPISLKRFRQSAAGITIVEVALAVSLLALFGTGGIQALLQLNKNANSTRVLASAREVVQRNMEAAMTVPFANANGTIAPVLVKTDDKGVGWNETSDLTGSTKFPIPLVTTRDGTVLVSGNLKRFVSSFTGSGYHPDTRRVTFTLTYDVNGKTKAAYTLNSIRSPD